jgi:regulator of sirC expression with transglutaminase-like and TPR domain
LAHDPYGEFRQAVDRGEDKIDLGRAALTIALTDYPDLDIAAYLARLDQLAIEVTNCCETGGDACQSLAALNYVLFDRHGFRGNQDDYYNPKNSFLNEVIERKQGIPITLSVLYMEVAQRLGLVLDGVGFPGHFLVKHALDSGEILVDPFHRGEIKSRDDLRRMLNGLYGGTMPLRGEFLKAATKKDILGRMLGNLKAIYLKSDNLVKLLAVLDQAIILEPGGAEELRDRGMVYMRLELFPQARVDFESYLRLAPEAKDAAAIRDQLVGLAKQGIVIH